MAEAQRYEERIETYRQADEKLAGSISYEEAYKVLEELLAEHDDEASQHRTDLAEYSAKKGGYKMAAALIDDAKQQLAEAKAQVEEGKKQLAEKEEQMKFLIELYENNKELVANGISTAADGKAECGTEAARLQAVVDKLNALIAAEPKAPEAPTEPTLVEKPEDESDSEKMEEYNRYLEQKAEYDKKLEEYNTELEKYKTEHEGWEKQCAEVRAEADFSQSAQVLRSQVGALEALGQEISAALPPDIAGSGIGDEISAGILEQIDRLDGMDESAMSNEEFLSNAGTLISALGQISSGYGAAGCNGNGQNGVCAQIGFIFGAVGLDHGSVDGVDVGGIHAHNSISNDGVDVLNSLGHALAQIAALVAVPQLQSFKLTSGCAGRCAAACHSAVGQSDLRFHGGVAAGVQDLAAYNGFNFQIVHIENLLIADSARRRCGSRTICVDSYI